MKRESELKIAFQSSRKKSLVFLACFFSAFTHCAKIQFSVRKLYFLHKTSILDRLKIQKNNLNLWSKKEVLCTVCTDLSPGLNLFSDFFLLSPSKV